jgi:rod shape determining protein RodA
VQNRLLFGADRKFDTIYFVTAFVLVAIGIALIFSARYASEGGTPYYERQIAWLLLSLVLFLVILRIPLRFYEVFAYPIFGASIVLLVAVLFLGRGAGGAVRWFDLGPFHFQPSEWAKLAAVMAGARFLSTTHRTSPWYKLSAMAAICGVPALLVLREPDLGTALVFGAVFLGMVAWANIPAWTLALLITPFVSLIAASNVSAPTETATADPTVWLIFFGLLVLVLIIARPGFWPSVWMVIVNVAAGVAAPLLWNRLHDYQKMRVLIFLDPSRDPQGAGYQIIQSKVAIGSGGIFGKGFLAGSQTHLKFLPAQHTDFVFAVLGEEFGLLGATLVLLLLAVLITRGFWFAQKTRNRFGSFLAVGISSIILFHVLVNVGMTLGMFPVTGLPLPFLSYGGSALLAMWVNIAIVLVVAERWQEY